MTQTYPPDPAAVGQHLADVSAMLVRRGHQVQVLASDAGFEDPSARYPLQEVRDGVHIRRLRFTSFGKATLASRLAGAVAFNVRAIAAAKSLGAFDAVLVATSPPLAPLAGLAISRALGAPLTWWIPDLNPEQAVSVGVAGPHSVPVRLYQWMNRRVGDASRAMIVLDDWMATRVLARPGGDAHRAKLHVIPPWSHDVAAADLPHAENPWRGALGVQQRLVVMYSGNHSPVHPLTTLLDASRCVLDEDRLRFLFVGGGGAKAEVAARGLSNVISLPYQPLDLLPQSLPAADVHVVSVGTGTVGIVHPSKLYGALAVGRPILLFAPAESPAAHLVARANCGWRLDHGDVEGTERVLRTIAAMPDTERYAMGTRAREVLLHDYLPERLVSQFCDVVVGRA